MNKKIFLLASLILLLVISCDRYIENNDPIDSLSDLPVPFGVTIATNSEVVVLSWDISNASAVSYYRIYRSTNAATEFNLSDSTSDLSLTISSLIPGQLYTFEIAAVASAGHEGKRSEQITARTGILSISIDGNNKYSNSEEIQIQPITGVPTSRIILSEDLLFSDSVIEVFSSSVGFSLSGGDGAKTVYAKFIFSDGSRSSISVSDEIILDTRSRIDSLVISPSSTTFVPGDTITFILDAGENDGDASVSFGPVTMIPLYNDGFGADLSADDNLFTGIYVTPLGMIVSDAIVTGSFRDEAGNTPVTISADELLSIQSPNLPVELILVEAISTSEMNLLWSKSVSSEFLSYRIFRGEGSTVTEDSSLVTTIANVSTTSFIDTDLDHSTLYSYAVFVRDGIGRDTTSNVMSASTLVNVSPQGVVLAGSLDADGSTSLLSWSTNNDTDFDSYRIFRSNTNVVTESNILVGLINSKSTTSIEDFIPASMDTAWYRVYVYDEHDAFTGSNTLMIVK